jgi:hypothetical protein
VRFDSRLFEMKSGVTKNFLPNDPVHLGAKFEISHLRQMGAGFMTAKAQGNNGTGLLIDIEQANKLGDDGMDKQQMPPELIQKIRETLAAGLAKNFINKALAELQSDDTCKASA